MNDKAHVETAPKPRHPGKGERKGRYRARGRQVEPAACAAVEALLENRPRRRDLLIEYLHLIQDRFGHLSTAHMAALAEVLSLAQTEVYETATFYAHFDIVREGEAPPPAVTVRVCDSLTCAMNGADALRETLRSGLGENVRVMRAPCMGACDKAPVAAVGPVQIACATESLVEEAVANAAQKPILPSYENLEAYRQAGGYRILGACLAGERTIGAVLSALEESGLRGLGGAGFPTARKWRLVGNQPAPKLMAVNADEGEPGTFKDRFFLETRPHRVIEGMLIGAWAVGAQEIYFYLRDEYPGGREILLREIAAVEAAGLSGSVVLHLRRGAGAYICGEESAMLESIEGKRGLPRHKPPFPAEVGLFGRPTLINNVETLFWVPEILERGGAWFAGQGRRGHVGMRAFSVSGRVREPGVKIAPAGVTVRELIEEFSGGMAEGHSFKGYLPGGASGGILPASRADIALDFDTLRAEGCFIGSAAVIVLSDRDRLRDVVLNLMRFFEDESCGQCTPCRLGTEKAVTLMKEKTWDEALLRELCAVMTSASICGLGQAAPNPLLSALDHFGPELPT